MADVIVEVTPPAPVVVEVLAQPPVLVEVAVAGPQGPQGITGPTGPAGMGVAGPTGSTGPTGSGTSGQTAVAILNQPMNWFNPTLPYPVVLAGTSFTPTVTNLPVTVTAGGVVCGPCVIAAPSSTALEVSAFEVTVTNQAGTEVLSIDLSQSVPVAAGVTHTFTAAELDFIDQQIGTDLVPQADGSIKSTAGGTFQAMLAVTLS